MPQTTTRHKKYLADLYCQLADMYVVETNPDFDGSEDTPLAKAIYAAHNAAIEELAKKYFGGDISYLLTLVSPRWSGLPAQRWQLPVRFRPGLLRRSLRATIDRSETSGAISPGRACGASKSRCNALLEACKGF